MQLSQAFHGACEAESALKAPSRGQEQQCATFVQAIVFIFPCDWWCVGTLRAVHKTGRLSATFCAVATRTPVIVWHGALTRPAVPSAVSYADVRQDNDPYSACGHGTHSHATGTRTVRGRCLCQHQAEMGRDGRYGAHR